VTTDNIDQQGVSCTIVSASDISDIKFILRSAEPASRPDHVFTDQAVRVKLIESTKRGETLLAVVENEGVVRQAGADRVLPPKALRSLKNVMGDLCKQRPLTPDPFCSLPARNDQQHRQRDHGAGNERDGSHVSVRASQGTRTVLATVVGCPENGGIVAWRKTLAMHPPADVPAKSPPTSAWVARPVGLNVTVTLPEPVGPSGWAQVLAAVAAADASAAAAASLLNGAPPGAGGG
jgi:hypothetical protein